MRLLRSWTSARAQSTTGLSAVIYKHDEPRLAGWAWRSRRRFWLPAANVSPIRATSRTQPGRSQRFKQYEVIVPTFEDKILQRAVAMVLEPIYEQDFLDCSYGFRPNRSAHQAVQVWRDQLMGFGGGWVIELDVERFFDSLDKAQLRAFLRRRVRDGVLLRLIGKWLNAGVLEDGAVWYPEAGTPQGGVASPLLANIFLLDVLGVWLELAIEPRLEGRGGLIAFAGCGGV